MKKLSPKRTALIIVMLLLTVVLGTLLSLRGRVNLESAYLWIAAKENALRGVDGITEASRLKVIGDAARHSDAIFCFMQQYGIWLLMCYLIGCLYLIRYLKNN